MKIVHNAFVLSTVVFIHSTGDNFLSLLVEIYYEKTFQIELIVTSYKKK